MAGAIYVWIEYRPLRSSPEKWEIGKILEEKVRRFHGTIIGSGTGLRKGKFDHQVGFRSFKSADGYAKWVAKRLWRENVNDLRVYLQRNYE